MKQLSALSPQERMIQEQLVGRGITDRRVLEAMRSVRRDQFVPEPIREQAHADRAAPIGHGQTISQPYVVALMTQKLEIGGNDRILEIGTGSGYQTAILAQLAGEVYTVERVKPLLDDAFERLLSMGLHNIHFRYGDGLKGWPENAPFDRLLIGAGAPTMPTELILSQLRDGGVAVLPVGAKDEQMLVQVRRRGDSLDSTDICACRFVKLIGEGAWSEE